MNLVAPTDTAVQLINPEDYRLKLNDFFVQQYKDAAFARTNLLVHLNKLGENCVFAVTNDDGEILAVGILFMHPLQFELPLLSILTTQSVISAHWSRSTMFEHVKKELISKGIREFYSSEKTKVILHEF